MEKEEVKLSLFVDYFMLYMEYPKDSIIKLLELTNKLVFVTGIKTDM